MSIFSRVFKIGQAHVNSAIDGLEKPEIMLDQAIRDQEQHIREVKSKVQSVIATERQTKALLDQEMQNKQEWENKAEHALKAGREDLATQALTRSEEHSVKEEALRPQWETQRSEIEKLKAAVRKMENELAEFKRNKDLIIAQSKAAEIKKEMHEVKTKISKKSNTDLIERMKAKAQRVTFEAEAAQEMSEESAGDQLEKEFETIETASASTAVKDRLASMKTKLGMN